MNIGFDWGGVLDEHPDRLTQLATALKSGGHEVYVISAINAGEEEIRKQQVEEIMPNICEVITLVAARSDQPLEKLKIALDKKIDMFFDDRSDICELLQSNGVLAFQVPMVKYL